MHGKPARYDEGSSAALVLCLGLYVAVAACFAFGVYELMQPSRHANPGLAAYKPPPATVIAYAPPSRPADVAVAAPAPAEPETVGTAEAAPAPPPAEAKPPAPEVKEAKVERPKRQRPARRREYRDPMMNYAAQPFYYGGYRSYAAQPFYGGYRPF
jgi:hypothetical protein